MGFDPASVHEGVGLSGMRERVSALGGRLEIVSTPDQRTSVKVEMPFTGSPSWAPAPPRLRALALWHR